MKLFQRIKSNIKERYKRAEEEEKYKIHYRIVGNGVLVADANDIVHSGAFQEQLRQSAELEKILNSRQK